MSEIELKRAGEIAYRDAVPGDPTGDPVLLVHGFPQSSYMWRHLMPALAAAGRRAVALDLAPGGRGAVGERPQRLARAPLGVGEHVVEGLSRAGLDYVAPEPVSLEDVYRDIRTIGGLLGVREPGQHDPLRLELDGYYGVFGRDQAPFAPETVALFPDEHPYPLGVQEALDWGSAGGVKLTYQPMAGGWLASGGIRYGRASASSSATASGRAA